MRVVLESMSDAVFMLDREWLFTYINPQAEKMLGRKRQDLIGRHVFTEFPDARGEVFQDRYERAVLTGQSVTFEAHYATLDIWVEVRAHPNPGGIAIYVQDISERKRAEQTLRQTEERFRRVFNLQFQFIALVAPDGRILEINDLPLPLAAVTREQVLGEVFWETPWWMHLPESRSAWQRHFAKAGESHAPVLEKIVFHTHAGELRHALAAITAVRAASGQTECFIVQTSDTTDQRRDRLALERSNRALRMLSHCNEACFRAEGEHQLLQDICRVAVNEAGYRMAWVGYAQDDPQKSIANIAHAGEECGYLAEIELSWSDEKPNGLGPAGRAIRTGKTQVCDEIGAPPGDFHFVSAAQARGFRSVICLPLVDAERSFGLLALYSGEVQRIGPEELTLLQQLAKDLTSGISTLRARENLKRDAAIRRRHSQQMSLLSAATLTANTQTQEDDLIQTLADALRETLTCHQALITLTHDDDGAQAIHAISMSDKYAAWRNYRQQPTGNSGIGAFVRTSGKSLRLTQPELEAHPHWHGFGDQTAAHPPLNGWLAVPLIGSEGQVIGLIQLSDCIEGEFSEDDEAIATQFAHMLSVTMERSRLIERLQERDRFFQLSEEMFCIARPNAPFLQVNAAFSRVLGWSREELTSRPFLDFVHPEDHAPSMSVRERVISGEFAVGFVNRYRHRDGGYRWLEWTSAAAPNGNIYAVARDITRRHDAERRLKQSLEELSTRNRELQDFASIASHDLHEPLRKVRAFAERLVANYSDRLDGPGLEYLERMTGAVSRMQRLIDALLDYSRVLSRARPSVSVELESVLQGVTEDLEERLRETGGQIEIRPLPSVLGDRIQLGQLFQNLISNALKFHQPLLPPKVAISAEPAELQGAPAWAITVEDNGIGFENEFRERIFAPFQRLHGRTEFEGTGIGLAIVRRIAERHGGLISAYGKPGLGACFTLLLPRGKPDEPALPESCTDPANAAR